ncbi:MAG: hypothetical protein K2G67_06960 [Muribaculaceae bacterium]|nr:hypothetical protein [Muribaculaceae bacterium]
MRTHKLFLAATFCLSTILPAKAQIGEIVNGLTNVALPAITQGAGYKGYVEADYTAGVGNYRTNFATVATSQGYQLNNWFYMGAGIGVDLLWSTVNKGWGNGFNEMDSSWADHQYTSSAVMIPVFTDFRFILGQQASTSFFINFRLGAAFLCSDSYVKIKDGYLTNREYFYFQPSVGLRIPVSSTKPRQALDVGVHYRLMTSNYWSNWQYNATINGLGLNIGFEW